MELNSLDICNYKYIQNLQYMQLLLLGWSCLILAQKSDFEHHSSTSCSVASLCLIERDLDENTDTTETSKG